MKRKKYWWEDELGLFRAWWKARTARLRSWYAENLGTSSESKVDLQRLGDI